MASDKRPADEARDIGLPPIGPVASTGYLAPTPGESSRAQHRDLSPSPSQLSMQPATPSARSDVGPTEYFPSLRNAPSFPQESRPPSSSGFPGFSGVYAPDEPPTPGSRRPSIRIRRRGSSTSSRPNSLVEQNNFLRSLADSGNRSTGFRNDDFAGRPRSISQPERTHIAPESSNLGRASRRAPQISMPRLTEEGARPTMEELGLQDEPLSPVHSLPEETLGRQRTAPEASTQGPMLRRMRAVSRLFKPGKHQDGQEASDVEAANAVPPPSRRGHRGSRVDDEYDELLVDYLDTIDPEIQTLSTLTNVQNSLFIPDLGSWVNRRPTYNLSQHDIEPRLPRPVTATEPPGILPGERVERTDMAEDQVPPQLDRSNTISSRLTDSHYAALPHGASLEGWTEDEKWELDDHVRHMLHSRRSRFKRSMKGFGQYVRRPLGFLVTLYATLITLFGLAWVLFLIGWIYVGDKQLYVIHVIDSVLVALFAVMGDGLAPFRAIDTYHMIYIVHYARIVKKAQTKGQPKPKRKWWWQKSEPEQQPQDAAPDSPTAQLPDVTSPETVDSRDSDSKSEQDPHHTRRNNIVDVDVEDARSGIEVYEDTPLTYAQQQKLYHHQTKLAKSHSFYKPNETNTHYAFPIDYLIAIVILLDCHSCLQISLGACTWGIDYHVRPMALTTVILCVSITCNITAGLIITIGDRKTRKKEVWKLMNRQELTEDAMKHIEQKRTTGQLSPEKSTGSDSDKEPLSQKAKRFVSLIVEEPEKEKELEKEAEKPKENGGSKLPQRVA